MTGDKTKMVNIIFKNNMIENNLRDLFQDVIPYLKPCLRPNSMDFLLKIKVGAINSVLEYRNNIKIINNIEITYFNNHNIKLPPVSKVCNKWKVLNANIKRNNFIMLHDNNFKYFRPANK